MEIIALQGHPKDGSGKTEAKKIRRNAQIPAIMYKSGGGEAVQFALHAADIRHLVYTSKFKLAEITLNGATYKCIVKDIQFHPVDDAVVHLDFLEPGPGCKIQGNRSASFFGHSARRAGRRQVHHAIAPDQHHHYA
ncbi:MAG: hypothetical protein IPK76_22205 [Lewinellaceae bacterium]|nr:hypothetical protein [Lewinellaceae bacterium]